MSKVIGTLILVVLIVVVGGGVLLATFDPPAPTAKVEKVVTDGLGR